MTKRSYEILRMKDKFQSLKIKVPTIFDLLLFYYKTSYSIRKY